MSTIWATDQRISTTKTVQRASRSLASQSEPSTLSDSSRGGKEEDRKRARDVHVGVALVDAMFICWFIYSTSCLCETQVSQSSCRNVNPRSIPGQFDLKALTPTTRSANHDPRLNTQISDSHCNSKPPQGNRDTFTCKGNYY